MKCIYIFAAVIALLLTACDKNDVEIRESRVPLQISATINDSFNTRVSGASWEEGDKIGLYANFSDAILYNNVQLNCKDGNFTPADNKILYIYNPMSLKAYYPYLVESDAIWKESRIRNVSTRAADQSADKQYLIDCLFASVDNVTSNNPEVELSFKHCMSKLTFKLYSGDGANVSDLSVYSISNLLLEGTFNTETGVCEPTSTAERTVLSMAMPSGVAHGSSLPSLILLPQEVKHDSMLLTLLDKDGFPHYCKLNFTNDKIEAGKHYQFNLTVEKAKITVNDPTISPWSVPDEEEFEGKGEAEAYD